MPKTSQHDHDVTGGIAGKLESALEIARMGVEVYIAKIGTQSAKGALLGKRPVCGTTIMPFRSK